MNLPNKLTLLRICLIPLFMWVLLWDTFGANKNALAAAIFLAAGATDWLDGLLARRMGLVTNFGKFMDPLADKLLVSCALIALVSLGLLPAWAAAVLISRDFVVTGFRLIAAEQNVVVAARPWGKLKTAAEMIMVISVLLSQGPFHALQAVNGTLIALCVLLAVISAADLIYVNREILLETGKG